GRAAEAPVGVLGALDVAGSVTNVRRSGGSAASQACNQEEGEERTVGCGSPRAPRRKRLPLDLEPAAEAKEQPKEARPECQAQKRVADGVCDVERQAGSGEDKVSVERPLGSESHQREQIHPRAKRESRGG